MNRTNWHSLWIIVLCLLTGCVEEVDLPDLGAEKFLVIEGRITDEMKKHQVKVTRSTNFKREESPEPVSGLEIAIAGPTQTHFLREEAPGIYRTDSIAGFPGEVYTLRVTGDDQLYEATDTMPLLPEPFTPVEFSKDRAFIDFEYRRHQFGFVQPNLWELHVIRDSLPADFPQVDPSRLGQQIGVEVSEDYTYLFTYYTHPRIEVSGLLNFEIPHFYGFSPGIRVVQKKFSLSEQHYRFLRTLFMETEWRGTLFPATPANIKGNISGGALGFFSAVSSVSVEFVPD